MKSIIPACLLIVFGYSLSFSATDCKVMEYADHSVVICIGDEKTNPDVNALVKPSQTAITEYVAQNHLQPQNQTSMPVTSTTIKDQQLPVNSGVTSQPSSTPATRTESAAEHLAKRKAQAEQNSRSLRNYSSIPVAPGK
jgi:hypothetical protein